MATYINPLLEEFADPIPAKGRSVRTRQAILPGVKLFANIPPLVSVNTGVDWDLWNNVNGAAQANWYANELAQAGNNGGRIQAAINSLTPGNLQIFQQCQVNHTPAGQPQAVTDYYRLYENCWDIYLGMDRIR